MADGPHGCRLGGVGEPERIRNEHLCVCCCHETEIEFDLVGQHPI